MILLIGASHDDVLYFETIIKNKVSCFPLFNRFPVTKGTIFNQDVTIVSEVYTSYATGAIVESIFKEELPLITILVGKCKSGSNNLKNGDIVISSSIMSIDVDQCEHKNVKLAQVPGFDQKYNPSVEIIHTFHNCCSKFLINNVYDATFLCSNSSLSQPSEAEQVEKKTTAFGFNKNIVFDSESFGIAVPCMLHDVPFFSVKAVDSPVGEQSSINNLLTTLNAYSNIGKAVVSFIGEIGRRDLVE